MLHKIRSKILSFDWYMKLEVALLTPVLRVLYLSKTFPYKNKKLRYFIHSYNATYSNERMLEIPIIREELKSQRGNRILEIGNVFAHYQKGTHDVLDLYEKHPAITHQGDVAKFKPKKNYDFVFSISTLEHVGFDEGPNGEVNPKKILEVLKKIQSYSQRFIWTFPLGFHHVLDNYLFEGTLKKMGFVTTTYKQEGLIWKKVASVPPKRYKLSDHILIVLEWNKKK